MSTRLIIEGSAVYEIDEEVHEETRTTIGRAERPFKKR